MGRAIAGRAGERAGLSSGYSGTPLARKLGAEPGARVVVLGGPPAVVDELGAATTLRGRYDVIVLFAASRALLERRLPAALRARRERGGIWLAWPKRGSGVESDLGDLLVRDIGLATGLVDNRVCAIDEVWSALRFVARRR
jgi:hypothetical protein